MQPINIRINLEWYRRPDLTRAFARTDIEMEAESRTPVLPGQNGASPIQVTRTAMDVFVAHHDVPVEIDATIRHDPVLQTLLQQLAARVEALCAAYPETPEEV